MQCPQCRQENTSGARFCNACGHALSNVPADARPADVALPEHESRTRTTIEDGERRQLTVLFCDLVGSTELSTQLDPEDWREVVRGYQHAATGVVARFSGHVAQYLGDGLLIYFGYPEAHEHDAERAVRAGLELLAAVPAVESRSISGVGSGAGAAAGARLAVRIGIHTGPVVVSELGAGGRAETLALGETPNVAARVQAVAAPNTVLITSATQRLVAGLFIVEEQGAQSLKGVRDPVSLYQVLQPSGVRSRLDVARAHGFTPFVGREDERRLLCKRWDQAQAGEGQVVLITGEAGIGKSRLVQQLKEHLADEPHTWLECGGSPYHQNTPFYAVVDLLQQVLARRGDESRGDASQEERIARLEQGLTLAGVPLTEAVPLMAPLLSLPVPERYPPPFLSPEAQRRRTFTTLAAWLCGAAKVQPVVAVLEDLHWADPSTLELQALLVEQGATAPLLLVYTARPEFRTPWPLLGHHAQLTLNRLTRAQVREMVERVSATLEPSSGGLKIPLNPPFSKGEAEPLPPFEKGGRGGISALPDDVIETMITRTDGVPLFIEELTKAVLEGQGSASARLIPMTLEDSLRARLDRLGPAKEVAQLGAVIGREFSYALAHAVSPLSEVDLQSALTRLVDAELLYARGQPPAARYVFKHALVRDAAYASLLKTRRRALHRAIATALTDAFPETAETQPELLALAHHYTEAGLTAHAIVYWQRAGQRAVARSANNEAISHLTKGLELLKTVPDTPERAQQELVFQTALGPALMNTKGYATPEVEHTYARARELCQQVGETPQLFPVLWGLWYFHLARADFKTARDLGDQCLGLAQRMQDPALLLLAHRVLGQTLYFLGEVAQAQAHLEQGMALYNPQQHRPLALHYAQDPQVACQTWAALLLWHLGYPDQARQRSHEALTLAQELSHPPSLAYALEFAAWFHYFRREEQAIQERAEAATAVSSEQGIRIWVAWGTIWQGWGLVGRGQGEEGIAQILQGLAASRATGTEIWRPSFLALLAEAYGEVGRAEEGLAVLAEALALVDKTAERHYEAELHRLKGEILLIADCGLRNAESDTENPHSAIRNPQSEAEHCFRRALEIARGQDAKSLELRAATSLARLLRTQGKPDEARALLAPIYAWFTEGFDTKDLQDAKLLIDGLS